MGNSPGEYAFRIQQAFREDAARELARVKAQRDAAWEANAVALQHVEELREAWRTGAISEHDGLGGTRSNRNVDVEMALRRVAEASRSEYDAVVKQEPNP